MLTETEAMFALCNGTVTARHDVVDYFAGRYTESVELSTIFGPATVRVEYDGDVDEGRLIDRSCAVVDWDRDIEIPWEWSTDIMEAHGIYHH